MRPPPARVIFFAPVRETRVLRRTDQPSKRLHFIFLVIRPSDFIVSSSIVGIDRSRDRWMGGGPRSAFGDRSPSISFRLPARDSMTASRSTVRGQPCLCTLFFFFFPCSCSFLAFASLSLFLSSSDVCSPPATSLFFVFHRNFV